jgi:GH15 family glucan-1,4-alpha-glucosidase
MTAGGVGEVIDFMPVSDPHRATDRHRLVRAVRCVRGLMRFTLDCAPRFDYGRQAHELELTPEGAVFHAPSLRLTLHGPAALERHGDDVRATITLRAGQVDGVILESATEDAPRRPSAEELLGLFEETARFWRGWLGRSTYRGRWREMVDRSAITLKSRRPSTISRATRARARCTSATAPPTSSSSTSTESCSTRSTSPTGTPSRSATRAGPSCLP